MRPPDIDRLALAETVMRLIRITVNLALGVLSGLVLFGGERYVAALVCVCLLMGVVLYTDHKVFLARIRRDLAFDQSEEEAG